MKAAIALLLLTSDGSAQWLGDEDIPAVAVPTVPRQAATVNGFVPKGWLLETSAAGDLNGDKRPDAALVLHMNDPRNRMPTAWDPNEKYDFNPRILVVAFAREVGGYELAAADHRLIPRLENQSQEDPFDEVMIEKGTLRVKMRAFMSAGGWWMGNFAHTLRWQNGGFKLIGFDRNGVTRNTGATDRVSINYLTRTKIVETGNIDGTTDKSRRQKLPKKPLLDLTQIGDGMMFDPDER